MAESVGKAGVGPSDKRRRWRRTEQLAAAKAEEEAAAEDEAAESAKAAQEVKTSATQPTRQEGAARRSTYVRTYVAVSIK